MIGAAVVSFPFGEVVDLAEPGGHGATGVIARVRQEQRHLSGHAGEQAALATGIDHDACPVDDDAANMADHCCGEHVVGRHGGTGVRLHPLDAEVEVGRRILDHHR